MVASVASETIVLFTFPEFRLSPVTSRLTFSNPSDSIANLTRNHPELDKCNNEYE